MSILENLRILLVEDDIVNQMLFQRSFFKLATKITIVESGTKAIDLLRNSDFDIVIMDLYLPDLDGCETAEVIRNDLKLTIPIIAITASPIEEEKERCDTSGMSGYIRKPFTIDQLMEIISKLDPPLKSKNKNLSGDGITIDLTFLETIADNDKEYIDLIIKTFNQNMPQTIEKIKQYYIDGDKDNLAKTAHFAKSSLSVIQIQQMFQQALLIETETKKTQLPDENIKQAIDKFEKQFTQAKNILENYSA